MNPMYSGIVLFDHTTDTTLQPLLVQKVVTAVGLLPRLALCHMAFNHPECIEMQHFI